MRDDVALLLLLLEVHHPLSWIPSMCSDDLIFCIVKPPSELISSMNHAALICEIDRGYFVDVDSCEGSG